LILRKIIKIVTARCQILRLKCNIIQLWLGLCPRPRWRSLLRSPRPLAGLRCLLLSESKGEKGRKGEEKGKEGGIAPMFLGGYTPLGLNMNFKRIVVVAMSLRWELGPPPEKGANLRVVSSDWEMHRNI